MSVQGAGGQAGKARSSKSDESRALYELMVAFLVARGWRRQHEGSGWWWRDGCENDYECLLGEAVEQELSASLDTREMVVGEPREFWEYAPGTGANRKDNRVR